MLWGGCYRRATGDATGAIVAMAGPGAPPRPRELPCASVAEVLPAQLVVDAFQQVAALAALQAILVHGRDRGPRPAGPGRKPARARSLRRGHEGELERLGVTVGARQLEPAADGFVVADRHDDKARLEPGVALDDEIKVVVELGQAGQIGDLARLARPFEEIGDAEPAAEPTVALRVPARAAQARVPMQGRQAFVKADAFGAGRLAAEATGQIGNEGARLPIGKDHGRVGPDLAVVEHLEAAHEGGIPGVQPVVAGTSPGGLAQFAFDVARDLGGADDIVTVGGKGGAAGEHRQRYAPRLRAKATHTAPNAAPKRHCDGWAMASQARWFAVRGSRP